MPRGRGFLRRDVIGTIDNQIRDAVRQGIGLARTGAAIISRFFGRVHLKEV
jgi:hypothetical protein